MAAETLRALVMATMASSAAVLLVALSRNPLRRVAGARAACWLWLLVPVMTLAVLLPAPSQLLVSPTVALPGQMQSLLAAAVVESGPSGAPWPALVLALWLAGTAAMLAGMVARQRRFSRSLGSLTRDSRGLFRGEQVSAPMLVGAWRPRIVVPADFDSRYSPDEQALVLAHEAAHGARRDLAINALASITLCSFWFNPLLYRALAWLRMDQELACDAMVLSRRENSRRLYADALLKTQLAAESAWRMPVACQWQSTHPLKERILMLKRPLPGFARRLAGVSLVLGLTGVAGYAAWAGQSAAPDKGPAVLVDLKVTITNPQTSEVNVLATRYLVHSGEDINDASAQPMKYACTPYLPDEPGRTTDWSAIRARGIPVPPAGQILVLCSIREGARVVASPAVMMGDGKPGAIETSQQGGPLRYRLDINASTSAARIADAKEESNASR